MKEKPATPKTVTRKVAPRQFDAPVVAEPTKQTMSAIAWLSEYDGGYVAAFIKMHSEGRDWLVQSDMFMNAAVAKSQAEKFAVVMNLNLAWKK